MRKKLLYLIFATSTLTYAQLPVSLLESAKRITMYDDYEGSVYQTLRYQDASVIDEKSGTFDAKLRYNIYKDRIEHQKDNELHQIVKSPTTHVRVDGDYFYFCEFKTQRGFKKNGYYVLVELNEQYRIYKRYTLKIKDPDMKGSVSGNAIPGSIQTITTYYLEERGTIMELPMNRKEMLATLGDKSEQMKAYIKKEKIKLRKEEDLIRLVSRYNALKSIDSGPSRSLLTNSGRN